MSSKQPQPTSSAHEPTTVPQSSYQKYQDEVRPEQIQFGIYEHPHSQQPHPEKYSKPQQQQPHEPLTNPPPQPMDPTFAQQQQFYPSSSSSRRGKFQQENIQINISNESVREINELINQVIQVNIDFNFNLISI